jgi:replicative superfamily II helicase
VCTIEKANSILNYLFDKRKARRLRMCVVDEVHSLSDDRRGFLLEVLLSKINYVLKEQTQIVCMSATLPNVNDLSSWLDASLYISSFRPVDLACNMSSCKNSKFFI